MAHSVSLNARTTIAYNEPHSTGISRIMAIGCLATRTDALPQTSVARGKE
jgi:hypothetical protein